MTREQILADIYPLPVREGDGRYLQAVEHFECLRAVLDYESPPPAFVFEGPIGLSSLCRKQSNAYEIHQDLQDCIDCGEVLEPSLARQHKQYALQLEALAKAIPMAEAGWEIYTYLFYVAVLVRPD